MLNLSKHTFTTLIDSLAPPMRNWLLTKLAALSPGFRNRFLYRVALRATTRYVGNRVFKTNMGISLAYNCEIPYDLAPSAVWGKPRFDDGEWHSMLLAGYLTTHCDAFIDVGSFIGYYVFYVWHQVRGNKPIYYFEPVGEYFHLIEKNISASKLEGICGFNQAMSDRNGMATFFRNDSYATCGSLTDRYVSRDDINQIEVSVVTFASFIESTEHQQVCVKVDVEGAEQLFIDGARSSLHRIAFLVIEVLDAKSPFLVNAKDLGFEVYHILPEGLRWRPEGTDAYVPNQWNWLLCRYSPNELNNLVSSIGLRVVV